MKREGVETSKRRERRVGKREGVLRTRKSVDRRRRRRVVARKGRERTESGEQATEKESRRAGKRANEKTSGEERPEKRELHFCVADTPFERVRVFAAVICQRGPRLAA